MGARAFDLLVALASRPGHPLSKAELLAQVWSGVTVEEGNLRFHIASLRKLLGDASGDGRYIATLPGRGYCFVAPVSGSTRPRAEPQNSPPLHANLPTPLAGMIGRTDDVASLVQELGDKRFITLLGPGGVGKTTVAIATAHELLGYFAGAVLFLDIAQLNDCALLAPTLASMLGLSVQSQDAIPSEDAIPALAAKLNDRRLLLILDTCEHLVEAVAELAERIFIACPQVHILATSRDALRVKGEKIYRLAPLGLPPHEQQVTANTLQQYPATQLFVERMMANGFHATIADSDAAIIANICQKLDGVPLTIELAAGGVEAYGLARTAALLEQQLTLPWTGQRSAPPRQRTLQATLDWSYQLLSEPERLMLRRLAIFVGPFTLEAALAIAGPLPDESIALGAIDGLIAKSMLTTRPAGPVMTYRLLDTTRTYARGILAAEGELEQLSCLHAQYCRQLLDQSADWRLSAPVERTSCIAELNEIRAALAWCFGASGDLAVGIDLAASASPVFLARSFLADGYGWSERALQNLDESHRDGRIEMRLQAAKGVSLMFLRGNTEGAKDALTRGLAIAERIDDTPAQLQLLRQLHMFYLRVGNFKNAISFAKRASVATSGGQQPGGTALAHTMLGISLHFGGELRNARTELEKALLHRADRQRISTIGLDFGYDNRGETILSWTLWLLGHPAEASALAHRNIDDATTAGHAVMLSYALLGAARIYLLSGDLEKAEECVSRLIRHAHHNALIPHITFSRAYTGDIAIRRGDLRTGIDILRECVRESDALNYRSMATAFRLSLVEGLIMAGAFSEAGAAVNETIHLIEENGDAVHMPEALRLKAAVPRSALPYANGDADFYLTQALALSRQQGSAAWELRAALDLARLSAAEGQTGRARSTLQASVARFTSKSTTPDLLEARRLLTELQP